MPTNVKFHDNGHLTIILYDDTDDDCAVIFQQAVCLASSLVYTPNRVVSLYINSCGGSVFAGLSIIDSLQSLQDLGYTVKATVRGLAASMAAIIFLFCDERHMGDLSYLMFHAISARFSSKTSFNVASFQTEAKQLTAIQDNIMHYIMIRLNLPQKTQHIIFGQTDTYLNSRQARTHYLLS